MGQYTKMIVAVAFAALQAGIAAFGGDAHMDPVEWVNIAIAGATVLGVYYGPNSPAAPYTKAVFAGLMAALMAAVAVADNGFQSEDLKTVGIAAFNAVLVFLFPNSGQ